MPQSRACYYYEKTVQTMHTLFVVFKQSTVYEGVLISP